MWKERMEWLMINQRMLGYRENRDSLAVKITREVMSLKLQSEE